MRDSFVHLRVHTEYSVSEGAARVEAVVARAAELNMPALGLADIGNMFGAVKFFEKCRKFGVKPIIGCDAAVGDAKSRLLLLCADGVGYRNLNRLLTRAYSENNGVIESAWLRAENRGIIGLSGGNTGAIGLAIAAGDLEKAGRLAAEWKEAFGDRFYIEAWNTGADSAGALPRVVAAASAVAAGANLPLVATHPVQCALESERRMLDVRRCIAHGWQLHEERPPPFSARPYLLSAAEMRDNFASIPLALENSVEIARRCNFAYSLGHNHLPKIELPQDESAAAAIIRLSQEGLAARGLAEKEGYKERLDYELKIINQTDYADYFLIVADFVSWAKDQNIPVGPGRGSGAASLVAYSLRITDIDPLEHGLLFERFLNPERVSLPDFDIDFCVEGRDSVIEYVVKKYGQDRVAQIVTFGRIAARNAVRDTGRVLGFPYPVCDRIAKLIPSTPGIKLADAIKESPQLQKEAESPEIAELLATSQQVEMLPRHVGTHAGGVLIAPTPIVDFCPLYAATDTNSLVSQMDMTDVEKIGLVKFDFLGLKTLTILAKAAVLLLENKLVDADFSLENIPMDDEKVFDIYARGDTIGVFQCESDGMRRLMRELRPDRFQDIVALMALYRPGPLGAGMVKSFIARKKGEEEINYPHPSLENVLEETYGVYAYQEQVMEIARRLSGYSLGEADVLRRAMGKKNTEEMHQQRERFVNGAKDKLSLAAAGKLFDNMEEFAKYGFNKAHSAAYAVVSYRTAYLKAHYPAALYAAVMSADSGDTDRLKMLVNCAKDSAVAVLKPDINNGQREFQLDADNNIIYGLQAIKGAGGAMVDEIVDVRGDSALVNIFDFCRRLEGSRNSENAGAARMTQGALENLVFAGAFDSIHSNRAAVRETLPVALEESARQGAGLFGEAAATALVDAKPWDLRAILEKEQKALGFPLSGSFYGLYEDFLEDVHLQPQKLSEMPEARGRVLIAGVFQKTRTPRILRQRGLEVAVLDDNSMHGFEMEVDAMMFREFCKSAGNDFEGRGLLLVEGTISGGRRGDFRFRGERLYTMESYLQKRARRLRVTCGGGLSAQKLRDFVQELHKTLTEAQDIHGKCEVLLEYKDEELSCNLSLGDKWKPRIYIYDALRDYAAVQKVKVEYGMTDV